MPDTRTANAQGFGEPTDRPLSILCREVGLTAVAIELHLELDTLRPDVAEAIERGAAALFDAGYRPSLIGYRRSVWAREKGSRHKLRRRASKARESRPFPRVKPEIELRDETEGIRTGRIGSLLNL